MTQKKQLMILKKNSINYYVTHFMENLLKMFVIDVK